MSCYTTQFENLKLITETQSENQNWHVHGAGRFTASNSKLIFNINLENPSLSSISTLMRYGNNFSNEATNYGTKMEDRTKKDYTNFMNTSHKNFSVKDTGLHIDETAIYIGASPDGIVSCACHDEGLVEIKCPFKYKNGLKFWFNDKNCPIDSDGNIKSTHPYYFQMQHQMALTQKSYCDFFVWSGGSSVSEKFCKRIEKNEEFCNVLREKYQAVFSQVILPEIVTRKLDPKNAKSQMLYCICKRPSFPPMIGCDNFQCEIEWFHFGCVNITRAPNPKKKWYCPLCTEKKKQN